MNDAMRNDGTRIAAWRDRVPHANIDDSGSMDIQTAEVAESGIDLSQLRANLQLTPVDRLEKMVTAANFLASIRGTVRRRAVR